ncbi:hypothetical protein JCM8547_007504 [Rhodosporidiobolus lusitaniae]
MAVTAHLPGPPPQAAPLAAHPFVSTSRLPLESQLLLAQSVAQLGTNDWRTIEHRIEHSKEWPEGDAGKLTSQGYHEAFKELMRERGLDPSACFQPLSRPSRKLVHSIYSSLLAGLRQDILTNLSEEARLNSELASIRASASAAAAASSSAQPSISAASPSAPLASTSSTSTSAALPPSNRRHSSRSRRAGSPTHVSNSDNEDLPSPAPALLGAGDHSAAEDSGAIPTPAGATPAAAAPSPFEGGALAVPRLEETPAPDADRPVKAEEEDEVMRAVGEEEGEEADAEENEEGEGEEEEQEEEEDEKERRKRQRKGRAGAGGGGSSRKSRTAAATAAKKAQQAKKRKQSEGPSIAGDEGAEETPPLIEDDKATAGTGSGGGRRARKRVRTTEEPVGGEEEKDARLALSRRKAAFTRIITTLQSERYSHFFETRVTRSIAPLYNLAVYRPTCLKDVLKKIKAGEVRDETELMREVGLLCANAMQFNGDEGEESVGWCAREMWGRFERLMDETLSTEFAAGEMAAS